jgi:hypothetical protein
MRNNRKIVRARDGFCTETGIRKTDRQETQCQGAKFPRTLPRELAGRSNAGLTEPAQNAALTFTKLAVLICLSPKLDDVVVGNIMPGLQEEIPTAFARADRRLQRKHKAFEESQS